MRVGPGRKGERERRVVRDVRGNEGPAARCREPGSPGLLVHYVIRLQAVPESIALFSCNVPVMDT